MSWGNLWRLSWLKACSTPFSEFVGKEYKYPRIASEWILSTSKEITPAHLSAARCPESDFQDLANARPTGRFLSSSSTIAEGMQLGLRL